MGRITVELKLTNYLDFKLRQIRRLKRAPRSLRVEALVDTGATRLYLKSSVIKALGLDKSGEVDSQTTNGIRRRNTYDPVHLELMGREGNFDVVEVDESVPQFARPNPSWTPRSDRGPQGPKTHSQSGSRRETDDGRVLSQPRLSRPGRFRFGSVTPRLTTVERRSCGAFLLMALARQSPHLNYLN